MKAVKKKGKKVKVEKPTERQKELMATLREKYSDPEILAMLKEGYRELCIERKVTFVDEPYTCTTCGRQNLKFDEISWKDDKDGQIDLSTVTCKACSWTVMLPHLLKYIKPGYEKETEKLIKKEVERFQTNYNGRLIRRVTKKRSP